MKIIGLSTCAFALMALLQMSIDMPPASAQSRHTYVPPKDNVGGQTCERPRRSFDVPCEGGSPRNRGTGTRRCQNRQLVQIDGTS